MTRQRHIWLNVVGEMNDLDRNALLRQDRLYGMKNLFRRPWRYSDTQHFSLVGFAPNTCEDERCQARAQNCANGAA